MRTTTLPLVGATANATSTDASPTLTATALVEFHHFDLKAAWIICVYVTLRPVVVSAYGPDSKFKIVPTAGGTPDNTDGIYRRPNAAVEGFFVYNPDSVIPTFAAFENLVAIINRNTTDGFAVPVVYYLDSNSRTSWAAG